MLLAGVAFCVPVPVRAAPPGKMPSVITPKVEWTPVLYKGRSYVPIRQVAAYYDLKTPAIWGNAFTIYRDKFKIELATDEKRVRLNGWTFYFSFAIVKPQTEPLISVFDVRNMLDPILRPTDRRDPAILRTVILDPGGGGEEGLDSKTVKEKEVTLETARLLGALLKQNGYRVVMTREDDKAVMPGMRVSLANDVPEESIFISLRAASGSSATKGFECSTLPPAGTPATNESDSPDMDKRFYPGNISDRESLALATTIRYSVISAVGNIDLGVRRVRLPELRDVRMPAIVCKLGYLSNKEEAGNLATNDYRAKLAASILEGIDRYAAFLRTELEERVKEDARRPLRFGPITVKDEPLADQPGGEKIIMRLPIVAAASDLAVDRSAMELQVFVFESVNDGEIDLTTANPPETKWLSVLPDWKENVPEWMQVTYLRPAFSAAESKQYGKRSYYGYVARLIYNGVLLDESASPANLNRGLYHFTPVFPRR